MLLSSLLFSEFLGVLVVWYVVSILIFVNSILSLFFSLWYWSCFTVCLFYLYFGFLFSVCCCCSCYVFVLHRIILDIYIYICLTYIFVTVNDTCLSYFFVREHTCE